MPGLAAGRKGRHARTAMQPKLAADIGGTFTDLALERGGERFTAKVLTTQAATERTPLPHPREH